MAVKVSVVIPNYNHGHWISLAIQGALAQDSGDVEVIVVDDGSTDDSLKVLEKIKHPFLKIIELKHNHGAIYALNRGIQEAKGDYLHIFAADDYIFPYSYREPLALLAKYPQAGMCVTPFCTWDGAHRIVQHAYVRLKEEAYYTPSQVAWLMFKENFCVAATGALVKKQYIDEMGGILPELEIYCDWYVMQVIALNYGVCFSPEPIATLRISEGSYSRITDRTQCGLTLIKKLHKHPILGRCGILSSLNWSFMKLLFRKKPLAIGVILLKKLNNRLRHPMALRPVLKQVVAK